jgi:hypothetical protein
MTGTNRDLFTHKSSRSYLNHLVRRSVEINLCYIYPMQPEIQRASERGVRVCPHKHFRVLQISC